MAFGYAGDARGGRAALHAGDGGAFLQALGIEQARIAGGRLQLDADVTLAPAPARVAGALELRAFSLLRSPVLARIFTLASFEGLASALSGEGIPVERLTVPFAWRAGRLDLERARLLGSGIGARADGSVDLAGRTIELNGTVAPAYTLNWVLGRIPLIGPIMRGREADAALAATFGVTGPLDAPDIVVNPLAALVPGIIRDLFRDLVTSPEGEDAPRDDPP
jgi:hypothetical protein